MVQLYAILVQKKFVTKKRFPLASKAFQYGIDAKLPMPWVVVPIEDDDDGYDVTDSIIESIDELDKELV